MTEDSTERREIIKRLQDSTKELLAKIDKILTE